MDEKFINWLNTYEEFKSGTELRAIMDDAIKCYKFNIPRPALMLSYLAFMLAVRHNLLISPKPDPMPEGNWNGILIDLRKDKGWDERVMSCIKANGEHKVVFNIDQSVRDDIEYWKNRRNDCAHYKKEEITLSHVSAFWSFLMSHYNQFTPLGSIQQCINEYNDYFDISKTPRGADQTAIFNRLEFAVKSKDDYKTFMDGITKADEDEELELINRSLESALIQDIVRDYLNDDRRLCTYFLEAYPNKVSLVWGDDPTKIRRFWYGRRISINHRFRLFIELLKSHLIPEDEIAESIHQLLYSGYENNECPHIEADEAKILKDFGLERALIAYLSKDFICSNPKEKCYKTNFYIGFLKAIGLTESIVIAINESKEGTFPYTLKDRIQDEILNDDANRKTYKDICYRKGVKPLFDVNSKAAEPVEA